MHGLNRAQSLAVYITEKDSKDILMFNLTILDSSKACK